MVLTLRAWMPSWPSSEPESPYAWARLAAGMAAGAIANVGMWSATVALPTIQDAFAVDRAAASSPYTATMTGLAVGTLALGRLADRAGLVGPLLIAAFCLLGGYGLASWAQSVGQFALAHVLIGIGASAGLSPVISDLSLWFTRRRGLAVSLAASGSYIAGAIWPPILQGGLATWGSRATHLATGIIACALLICLLPMFRRRPTGASLAAAQTASSAALAQLGLSGKTLLGLLVAAGFACCMAMAMPQAHIVAYCGDLGYGAARGAQMLSLMLALGIVSRIASGVIADRLGAAETLFIGSFLQAMALFLYLWFDGLASLYVVSALFGLFQGGIVPMYAVVIREYLPPRQAGGRISAVMAATMVGMAAGGYAAGAIYDQFQAYAFAFAQGLAWNIVNMAIVAWLLLRMRLTFIPRMTTP